MSSVAGIGVLVIVGGSLGAQVFDSQTIDWQSASTRHPSPFAHAAQVDPPQSASVSSWFCTPSLQVAVTSRSKQTFVVSTSSSTSKQTGFIPTSAVVGVHSSSPALEIVRPAGPEVRVNTAGSMAPGSVETMLCEYAASAVADPNWEVSTLGGTFSTVQVDDWVELPPSSSVTSTPKGTLPLWLTGIDVDAEANGPVSKVPSSSRSQAYWCVSLSPGSVMVASSWAVEPSVGLPPEPSVHVSVSIVGATLEMFTGTVSVVVPAESVAVTVAMEVPSSE